MLPQTQNDMTPEEASASLGISTRLVEEHLMSQMPQEEQTTEETPSETPPTAPPQEETPPVEETPQEPESAPQIEELSTIMKEEIEDLKKTLEEKDKKHEKEMSDIKGLLKNLAE